MADVNDLLPGLDRGLDQHGLSVQSNHSDSEGLNYWQSSCPLYPIVVWKQSESFYDQFYLRVMIIKHLQPFKSSISKRVTYSCYIDIIY